MTIVILAVLYFLLVKSTVKRLGNIQGAISQIRNGGYRVMLPNDKADCLGALERDINAMAMQIKNAFRTKEEIEQSKPAEWYTLCVFASKSSPELLEDYTCDSDEDTYFAFYPATKQGEINGKNLVGLIKSLLRNIELLYQFVKETSDEIDWQ